MTRNRKALAVAAGVLGASVLGALVLSALLEGPIESRVRTEIGRATRVSVDWQEASVGLLRSFPHLAFALEGLSVVGTGTFEGDTLAVVGSLRLVLDGPSLVRAALGSSPIVVRSVRISDPSLWLEVDPDGTASWDIVRLRAEGEEPGELAGEAPPLAVALRSFELTGGRVSIENANALLFGSIEGLSHSLRGDFSAQRVVARSTTHADRATLWMANVPYLVGASLDLAADLDVDLAEGRVRILENELRLNELVLRLAGEVARQGEDLGLDLALEAPRAELRPLLSLVPSVHARDFAALEASGSVAVRGQVRGAYGRSAFPAFSLTVTVADGSVRYPDLPIGARGLTVDLAIDNPGGDIDSTVVKLSRFHVELEGQPLDAALTVRTPLSDLELDANMRGTLDLTALARALRLGPENGLQGVIVADAAVRARRSDVVEARWERVDARGTISVRDLALRAAEFRQPVALDEVRLELSPQRAELRAFRARAGSSDVEATGRLDNLLGYVLGGLPLTGTGTFTSRRVVLDEWRSGRDLEIVPVPDRLDLALDGTMGELQFGALRMTDARGRLLVRDRRLTLDAFTLRTLGGRVAMSGYYETLDPTKPRFAFDLDVDSVDVASTASALLTVRTLAPVARYARGTFSSRLSLSGVLGQNMTPVLDVLDGQGSLQTSRLAIEGFPVLDRLAEMTRISALSRPTVEAVRSSIRIEDGRLHVAPFRTTVGALAMEVSGSNGIDQSLDYTLGLAVPRSGLGDAALDALSDLAGRIGGAGVAFGAADVVQLGVRVGGTVSEPALGLSFGPPGGSARDAAVGAARAAVDQRLDDVRARADAEREEARLRARAEADSLVAEAERQAEALRAEARRRADEVRAEGNRAADDLLARAANPVARAAAQPAADRLRREAEERASALEREAGERADALVSAARRRADALVGPN
jgi:hypothetical protein